VDTNVPALVDGVAVRAWNSENVARVVDPTQRLGYGLAFAAPADGHVVDKACAERFRLAKGRCVDLGYAGARAGCAARTQALALCLAQAADATDVGVEIAPLQKEHMSGVTRIVHLGIDLEAIRDVGA